MSTMIDRLNGVVDGLAYKTPVRAATTANITLSGLQTVDGVSLIADDRVLVKDQSTASLNGIYDVSSGPWTRSRDFDGNRDVTDGTQVFVTGGATHALSTFAVVASAAISIGTNDVVWQRYDGGTASLLLDLKATLETSIIPARYNSVRLNGRDTVGVGAANWRRYGLSVPGHAFWVRDLSNVYWELAEPRVYAEMVGFKTVAVGGALHDNAPYMDAYNDYCAIFGCRELVFTSGVYRFLSKPKTFPYNSIFSMSGETVNGTVLARHYEPATATEGFITYTSSGNSFSRLSIQATAGTQGIMVSAVASADYGASALTLDKVIISPAGGTYSNSVSIDGSLKTTGALGSRDNIWSDVTIFGSVGSSNVKLHSVAGGLTWNGGGCFPAGGSGAGAGLITVSGTAGVRSEQISINVMSIQAVASLDAINLSNSRYVRIVASSIQGNIIGASTALGCQVITNYWTDGQATESWVESYIIDQRYYGNKLLAARTYYVNGSTGSDSYPNTGRGSGEAFATIQKAIDVASALDLGIYDITIALADGTYTAGATLKPFRTSGGIIIVQGNTGTPTSVIVSTTNAPCFTGTKPMTYRLRYLKMQTTTSGNCIEALEGAKIESESFVDYGPCAGIHMFASSNGYIKASQNYAISGGANRHWYAELGGVIDASSRTVTFAASATFTTAFAVATTNSPINCFSMTFTMGAFTATGSRYAVTALGLIYTNGGGASYLPGNAVGTAASGGEYV